MSSNSFLQQDSPKERSSAEERIELSGILPEELAGHFFGVGSLGEPDPIVPVEYVKKMALPYSYAITSLREEDMIRQFAALVEGYEEQGDFILDIDLQTYREITSNDEPLLLDKEHGHSLYLMNDGTKYSNFKTQQTAPATMCFSTRDIGGKQHITKNMFHFFQRLMTRIAEGQVNHLKKLCEKIIFCQDDPGLGFVIDMIGRDLVPGLTVEEIIERTDRIYPNGVIPAFHYCDDWRAVKVDDWYPLWESRPKIAHIDLVRYLPELDQTQAEKVNEFLKRGGGLALGVLPNVDDSYSDPLLKTLENNLNDSLKRLNESGVDMDLLRKSAMISTQCGLSGASPALCREIHEESPQFQDIFFLNLDKIQ
ncbi:MAG: hypothetical protein ACW96M_03060 [Candidatus Thorarchaeota archaeon]|jgi:hypothetical protein